MIRLSVPRVTAAAVLGTCLTLSACKKNADATTDTATAATTPPPAMGDTTAMNSTPNATTSTTTAANGGQMTDAQIMGRVVAANKGEIAAGKMAETKATNPDVKAFARMMVTDHSKMLSEGNALAKRANITPDTTAADSITRDNKTTADLLSAAAKGTTFDTAYVNAQVVGHQNTLDMLKAAAGQAQNADLKKMLNDAQTPVQHHLDRIKAIQSKMK